MDLLIADELNKLLKKEIKQFKHFMLDEDYTQFKDYSDEKWFSLFIFSIIDDSNALKQIKLKSIKAGINQKDFNDFFYTSMKWLDKQNRGIWSWYEADYFNIDIDDWKETTLTYTLI
tara:strand:- start:25 stop:375 length:351 start_codon:yes stop_codon:yes gene_type:complete